MVPVTTNQNNLLVIKHMALENPPFFAPGESGFSVASFDRRRPGGPSMVD
jgi:hypothetical protein